MILAAAPWWCLALLGLLLVAAAVQDVATLKISNVTNGAILLLGVVAIMVMGPRLAVWQNIAVFAALLTLGTILFAAGKLGGGDVKLLAAGGLWFPVSEGLQMLLAVALAGGGLALLILLARSFRQSDRQSRIPFLNRGAPIPYGVAIAIGMIFAVVVQRAEVEKLPDPAGVPSLSSLAS